MKTTSLLLLLLLLCASCQKKENIKGFYVTTDTLNISLPGNVGGGVKLGNKYYIHNWKENVNNDFDFSWNLCSMTA